MKKRKSKLQICEKCGLHYINRSNHDITCAAIPHERGLQELCEKCGTFYDSIKGHACFAETPHEASAAIIIPRKHQSAPKEHWADREVRLAAQEIVEGKASGTTPSDEFWNYGETQTVAEHPRVVEALRKLESEMEDCRNTQELLEKTAMYHEMNERAAQVNQWDGQGRWMGKENEEMRHGELLTPQRFMERLERVIGPGRVWLNSFAVYKRVALLAPDPEGMEAPRLVNRPGMTEQQADILQRFERDFQGTHDARKQMKALDATIAALKVTEVSEPENLRGKKQVATLQYPLGTEWMIMRFDEYGVPTEPKHLGWRTALLSLISLGVITEKEAHRAFPVGSGPAANWYREQMQMMRQRGSIPA